MRLTKIVCTLGPTSISPENILGLMQRGMNVARVNFSHSSQEGHLVTINTVKEVNAKNGYDTAILLDTKGPEIRTGDVTEPIVVKKGEEVLFTYDKNATYAGTIVRVNYAEFGKDVLKAEAILVDNGELTFTFVKANPDGSVVLRAEQDGKIGNRRHVNLPGADISLPSLTEQDWSDLAFGVKQEMDYVALSFIRTADEVKEVRTFLDKEKSGMQIVSKIETRQSVQNIDAIIAASDAIMVARGDLGAEMPFQKIPVVQDMIVRKCRDAGKPVIVATQMLESMIKNPMPTRAEVTDVAHAATTRTDATMLSGETANGAYPFGAVEAMASILEETEAHLPVCTPEVSVNPEDDSAVRAAATVAMAQSAASPAIVVICKTGHTAEVMSNRRASVAIYAFSDSPALRRRLQLFYGVVPMPITLEQDSEQNAENALQALAKKSLVKKGDRIAVLCRTNAKSGPIVTTYLKSVA